MKDILRSRLSVFSSEEQEMLQFRLDFIGLNHYSSMCVKDCMYSPCSPDSLLGDSLVIRTGESNGIPIGKPVSDLQSFLLG